MLTLYKASAGSGKTYTLTREYIKLLLGRKNRETGRYTLRRNSGNAHRNILAVTFTIAATNEMKRRIIDHLELLGNHCRRSQGQPGSPYMEYLTTLYGATQDEVALAARTALKELLMDFSQFNISTIDAFFQTVLRTFAREIDLPGNYEVELDEGRVTGIGVGDMITSLNFRNDEKTARLTRWLTNFMSQSIDEGKGFNLFNRQSSLHEELVGTMNKLLDETFKLNRDSIIDYLQGDPTRLERFEKSLIAGIARYKASFTEAARTMKKTIADHGLTDAKAINANLLKFIVRAAKGWQEKLTATLRPATENPGSRYTAGFIKAGGPPPALDETLAAGCAEMLRCHTLANEYRLLLRNLYNLGLLGYLMDFVGKYRRDNDIILLSDTNELLRRIIRDDLTPFIYERIGYFLNHFLIDEFQDTSRMQWGNMMPLLLESLSHGNDNLIIGDEKQCIYRFRNSDPDLLALEVKTAIEGRIAGTVTERGIDVADNTNWRSSRDIVRFNNAFFTSMARIARASDTYANLTQQVSPKHIDSPAYISLAAINESKGGKPKGDEPKGDEPTFEELALKRMADEIKRQIQAGYRAKDIAVIVRWRREGEAIVNYLLQLMEDPSSGFPRMEITSSDSIELQSSAAIRLIISVLQIIDSTDATSGSRRKTARELAQLVNRFEYFYNQANLNGSDALAKALADDDDISALAAEAAKMTCVNLPSMVERIISRYLSPCEMEENNIFISAFQDQVIDFCSRGQSDIHSFLQWWQQSGRYKKLEAPADMDALTVMTIHKVKGLQYPCVHIPFATWAMTEFSRPGKTNYEWYRLPVMDDIDPDTVPPLMPLKTEAALADTRLADSLKEIFARQRVDNINLLYVAFTRAERELIITTKPAPEKKADDRPKEEPLTRFIINAIEQSGDDDTDLTLNLAKRWDGKTLTIGAPTAPAAAGTDADTAPSEAMPPYSTCDRDDMWQLTRVDDLCVRSQAQERGIFLHDVLSRVRHRSDLPLAMRRRAYRTGLTSDEETAALKTLTAALDDPRAARWFDGYSRVVNERTIMLPDGSHYRPDRVVWTADDTIEVIDYKFGAEHNEKYSRQVKRYTGFLREIYPAANVKGYLWYPDNKQSPIIDIDTGSTIER